MKTEFNVNEYWLERGRTYIDERRTPPEFHRLQERFLFDVLRRSEVPMRRVLEIGCGFGRITKLLAETWTDADITALDLSPEQLTNARRYCGEDPRVHLVQYDFYSSAPLPGGDYDAVVAIEVFLHHPPEFVVQLFKRLSGVARSIVNIDWSEDWLGPLPVHVWVHDFAKLYAEAGLKCASFSLPEKVDGKQQKLFIAGHDLPDEVKRLERSLTFANEPICSAAARDDSTEQLRLATDEPLRIIPAGSQFILVDDGQSGNVRAPGTHRVLPFLEKDGVYWGPPPDDATAWRELERLRRTGASHIAFASPSFWWLEHFGEFARRLRGQFPCVLENERLVVFKLDI
jgi:SAM-dependent methyltransferase